MKFSSIDLQQIEKNGANLASIQQQVAYFKSGFPYMTLEKAATPNEGIVQLSEENLAGALQVYNAIVDQLNVVKFTPASGAASRMFKSLFAYIEEDKTDAATEKFLNNTQQFAFAQELESLQTTTNKELITQFLTDQGMGYGQLPKGLLTFHKYADGTLRTAVEEHLAEGALYANSKGTVNLHFTVSPEHLPKFKNLLSDRLNSYEKALDVRYKISYSTQKESTDTLAVDLQNNPFRDKNGQLLFRPAGHGALLSNLNDLNADLVFIKNIDNVVPDHHRADTVTYKKALAGILVQYQQAIFESIVALTQDNTINTEQIATLIEALGTKIPATFAGLNQSEKANWLLNKLQRPLRVCGMVRNQGEPGGGPFWCKNPDGTHSLQIVESAQVDLTTKQQKDIFSNSTHFNPVDLVISSKKLDGTKYNLEEFVDPLTGFITEKSKDGQTLKAMELPGLWNGSMANWNTVFVEVPLSTFNPVKTINDLLLPAHQ
jgi:hypothetical protein